jgi:Sec-independent protein secretion pathway component TatC
MKRNLFSYTGLLLIDIGLFLLFLLFHARKIIYFIVSPFIEEAAYYISLSADPLEAITLLIPVGFISGSFILCGTITYAISFFIKTNKQEHKYFMRTLLFIAATLFFINAASYFYFFFFK